MTREVSGKPRPGAKRQKDLEHCQGVKMLQSKDSFSGVARVEVRFQDLE